MVRILVIDDDDQIRVLLGILLRRAGYEVVEAANGSEGLKLFRASPADLILTDILMPEKGGLETIQEVRRDFPKVKVIALSGGFKRTENPNLPITEVLGVQRIVTKPFAPEDLLKTVREVLAM